MKKILSLLVLGVMVLACLLVQGCGGSSNKFEGKWIAEPTVNHGFGMQKTSLATLEIKKDGNDYTLGNMTRSVYKEASRKLISTTDGESKMTYGNNIAGNEPPSVKVTEKIRHYRVEYSLHEKKDGQAIKVVPKDNDLFAAGMENKPAGKIAMFDEKTKKLKFAGRDYIKYTAEEEKKVIGAMQVVYKQDVGKKQKALGLNRYLFDVIDEVVFVDKTKK